MSGREAVRQRAAKAKDLEIAMDQRRRERVHLSDSLKQCHEHGTEVSKKLSAARSDEPLTTNLAHVHEDLQDLFFGQPFSEPPVHHVNDASA